MIYQRQFLTIQAFLWVLFVAITAFAENVKITENAREHFKAGLAYLEEPGGAKYEEAYREFKTAYAESPSYKILNNIAVCSLYLERDGEAIDAYERYLAVAPKEEIPSKKREQIDSDLKRLKAGLVKLEIRATPAEFVLVDQRKTSQGTEVVNRYTAVNGVLSLGIHPGVHQLTISADGYAAQTWELEAAPASTQTRTVKLTPVSAPPTETVAAPPVAAKSSNAVAAPPETPQKSSKTPLYVSAIATGVFAATATVTGLLALSKKSDLEKLNEDPSNHNEAVDTRNEAKSLALFCDISLGATAIAAAVTTYFIFTTPGGESPPKSAKNQIQISPVLSPQNTGVTVLLNF
jgi:hypothetical protein